MYENAFNNIEKALCAEQGIANELDYVEQTSWVLFLKYLHDLEDERQDRAELEPVAPANEKSPRTRLLNQPASVFANNLRNLITFRDVLVLPQNF